VLGAGCAQALPHLSSQVTADRLPRVWPSIGSRRFIVSLLRGRMDSPIQGHVGGEVPNLRVTVG